MARPRLRLEEVKHGTITGYSWHKRWPENPVCDLCKAAKAKKNRDDIAARKIREREAAPLKAAWQRAVERLAEKYPDEFRDILAEEIKGLVTVPPEDEQGEQA